jgi:hypothetical protein
LLYFANRKEIELELKCIDFELEFRRTAFILSSFETKLNPQIGSLSNVEYIANDSVNRAFLLNYVNELSQITKVSVKLTTLNNLKSALLIDCTICFNRDQFMYENFIEHYDPTDAVVIGTFGLDNVVSKPDFSSIGESFKFNHKIDTVGHSSLYNLLKKDFKNQIFRIGIITFKQSMKRSNVQKPKDYSHIMKKEERDYIEMLLDVENVLRLHPNQHKKIVNLSSEIDYLIVYKSSSFR